MDSRLTTAGSGWHFTVQPRAWQQEALAAWESQHRRGIVSVVTGAGKTIFAEMCMVSFLSANPTGRVAIVVPTIALLDQWYVSLREDLGVPENDIALYSGEGRPAKPGRFNLLVLNTARSVSSSMSNDRDALLIVDEVHRAASPVNSLALAGKWSATLGMSATPERDYDDGFQEILVPSLGPLIYQYDYGRASRDGVIAPFHLVNVRIDLLAHERDAYAAATKRVAVILRRYQAGDDAGASLRVALQRRASISATASLRVPVSVYLAEKHRGIRTIIFHERVQAAEQIYELLRARGISTTIYHSKINPILRRDNLRLFRHGAFNTLVTCRALDEGVNVPETAIAIVASSTASLRQRIQRMGRVLRPAPGKTSATVYTIYATEVERRRLEAEAISDLGAESITWMEGKISKNV